MGFDERKQIMNKDFEKDEIKLINNLYLNTIKMANRGSLLTAYSSSILSILCAGALLKAGVGIASL